MIGNVWDFLVTQMNHHAVPQVIQIAKHRLKHFKHQTKSRQYQPVVTHNTTTKVKRNA